VERGRDGHQLLLSVGGGMGEEGGLRRPRGVSRESSPDSDLDSNSGGSLDTGRAVRGGRRVQVCVWLSLGVGRGG